MSRIRSRDMKPERIVRSLVHRLGFRFRLHRSDLPGRPDLVLPRHRAVIFVNGCFWHWHDDPECRIAGLPKSNLAYWRPKLARTRTRDRSNTRLLRRQGWRILTLWECELGDRRWIEERVLTFLTPTDAATTSGSAPRAPRQPPRPARSAS